MKKLVLVLGLVFAVNLVAQVPAKAEFDRFPITACRSRCPSFTDRVRVGMGPVTTTRDITGGRTATATTAVPTGAAGTGRAAAGTGGKRPAAGYSLSLQSNSLDHSRMHPRL